VVEVYRIVKDLGVGGFRKLPANSVEGVSEGLRMRKLSGKSVMSMSAMFPVEASIDSFTKGEDFMDLDPSPSPMRAGAL
jgi:hypothetical protein